MNATFKKALAVSTAIVIGLGFVGTVSTSATAATTPAGSTDEYHIYDLDGVLIADGATIAYDFGVVGTPSNTDPEQLFTAAPDDATQVKMFIAPRGEETNMSNWSSTFVSAFKPGTKQVLQAPTALSSFPSSTFAAVRAAGGDYSIGFAYTKNNGVTFVGMGSFAYINITAGTAAWRYTATVNATVPPVGGPATGSPGEIGLEATVAAPIDGAFSLSIPAAAKATLGAPSFIDNKSTSTGTLPTFTVTDERRVALKGWDATASVATFARSGGTETITADNLKIAPKTIVAGTTSAGVTTVAPFQASSTAQPFASAPAGSGLGVTNLSADLTFAAPAGSVQGTYTSKMTVTVVSK